MASREPGAQAPSSPSTGGRAALTEAVGSIWSALVLGLLAAIFAWFWFGGSDESEDPTEAPVPTTEPVETAVGVGEQQATRVDASPVRAEAAAAEHLLKTELTSVFKVQTNYENQTELDMDQSKKHDSCYDNQKDFGNFDKTSAAYPIDNGLEVVFPSVEGASDGHEVLLDSLMVEATPCEAQEALLGVITTAEGAQSSVQATVLDHKVLRGRKDAMDTFTSTEATESSAQQALLKATAVQYAMQEAAHGAVTATVHKDVSEVSPTAIAAAPITLQEAVMDAYTSTEAAQFSVQNDELAVEAEHFSGLEHELAAEAVHAVLQKNGLVSDATQPNVHEYVHATKATPTVLQREVPDAESEHTTVQEDGLHAEAARTTVQEDGIDAEPVHAIWHADGLHTEAAHTTVQDDGLDAEAARAVDHKDQLDAEATHTTVAENVLDAEAAHAILHKDGLNRETHTTVVEDGLDAKAAHARVWEDVLGAEAAQASIVQEVFVDFSPAAKDIQNIYAASKAQELLLHTVGQKLGYINGQEVIDHFAGGHETSTHKGVPTDSNATKELENLHNYAHVSDENSDQLYISEPQPRNIDSDSKTRKIAAVTPMPQYVIVKFRVHYITHSESQLIAVTGNHQSLGEWNTYVPLKPDKDGFWADFVLLPVDSSVEWKFVMVENGKIKRWEECTNRHLKTGHDDTEAHQWWGYH